MKIIFGLEEVLSNGIQDVLAYQQAAMEGLREVLDGAPPDIGGRLAQGSLQFMVMRSKVSHKKTFLLSGSGRVPRVIVGSANLSVPGRTSWNDISKGPQYRPQAMLISGSRGC